ncbi:MAG: hypothetical protein JW759_04670 [Candidatus Coatesbacteria bacterium]|nr:hypothetical protein [Candidatus Coatesbacteria bacterium]
MSYEKNQTIQVQDKEALVKKRLLLAKMMYEHGRDHSEKPDPLSKMLAIHHFHNAVEITLKCVFDEFRVKTEKHLRRLGFEALWDEIDKHLRAKVTQELPWKRQMMVLNDQRNLVQHAASEPGSTVLMESNVNTKNFLVEVFRRYFEEDYETLNPRSLIHNDEVREALNIAAEYLKNGDRLESSAVSKMTYWAASRELHAPSLPEFLSDSSLKNLSNRVKESLSAARDEQQLEQKSPLDDMLVGLSDMTSRILMRQQATEDWMNLLSIDTKRADLLEFYRLPPLVEMGPPVKIELRREPEDLEELERGAMWLLRFVTESCLRWQSSGLNVIWPPEFQKALEAVKSGEIKVSTDFAWIYR